MGLDEYKQQLGFDNRDFVNIYFADWTTSDLFGVSTFPWDPNAHTNLGTPKNTSYCASLLKKKCSKICTAVRIECFVL